jgi:hypothetical protein
MIDETALARLARQYSREAIAALVFAVRNSTDVRVRVTAALGLLDRGYGRPAQAKPPGVEVEISLEDIDRMIAHVERKLVDQGVSFDPAMAQTDPGEAAPSAGGQPLAIAIAETVPPAPEPLVGRFGREG